MRVCRRKRACAFLCSLRVMPLCARTPEKIPRQEFAAFCDGGELEDEDAGLVTVTRKSSIWKPPPVPTRVLAQSKAWRFLSSLRRRCGRGFPAGQARRAPRVA